MATWQLPPLMQPRQRGALGSGRAHGPSPKRAFQAKSKVQAATRATRSTSNINDFFKNMQRDIAEEGEELDAVGKALQDQRRVRERGKRAQRPPSGQKMPDDVLKGAREAYKGSSSCSALPALSAPAQPRRPGRDAWVSHDEAWERFQDQPTEPLYVEAVPWPPHIDDVLDFYEQVHSLGDMKKAYRLACRRWHPDKFLQRYGSLVPADELPYMRFRINEVFQAITAQWEREQKTHRR